MVIKYPASIDTSSSLPEVIDNSTPVRGVYFNKLREAILAIETELGVKPSSIYTTVRSRLDIIENIVGNLQIIELNNDLGGTLEEPLVIGIQGRPVSTEAPVLGSILSWDGIAWIPTVLDSQNGVTFGGDLDGTALLQTVIGLQNNPVSATAPTDGYALIWDNLDGYWEPTPIPSGISLGGDLGGTISSQTVIGLQTNPINNTAPTDGQTLIWSDIDGYWRPSSNIQNLTIDGYKTLLSPITIVLPLVAGLQINSGTGAGTAIRIGATVFDPNSYADGYSYITRTFKIRTVLQASSSVTTELKIYNTDTADLVATFTSTSNSPERQISSSILVGSGANKFANTLQTYEAQLRISSPGSPTVSDISICYSAQIEISYS